MYINIIFKISLVFYNLFIRIPIPCRTPPAFRPKIVYSYLIEVADSGCLTQV